MFKYISLSETQWELRKAANSLIEREEGRSELIYFMRR